MKINLRDLLLDIEVIEQIGNLDVSICEIVFDSRKVKKDSLFVAQKGTQIDGHNFIDSAIDDGARVVVLEQMPEQIKEGITYLKVKDSSKALALLARNYYDNPSSKLKLIGITGTNGKTTTVTLSYNLFKSLGYECGLISTIVNKIGDREIVSTHTTPDSLSFNKSNFVKHIIGFILLNSITVSNLSSKFDEKSGIFTLVTITA
jgi:UDP-N-acetylmuramoyl-L-alanyl-D-glutamate--2,6-diaminopimelate ligase